MKIIFDSEEQKRLFLFVVAPLLCPGDVGANGPGRYDCVSGDLCEDCWPRQVEMEVKSE